jgi:hypothetical protein
LFYQTTDDDERARIPVAAGVTHILGKGPQRRFNEFFAMSADEFCLFEFNYDTHKWDRIPMGPVTSPAVSSAFGPGRNEKLHQIYLATIDGKIYEWTRQATPYEPE